MKVSFVATFADNFLVLKRIKLSYSTKYRCTYILDTIVLIFTDIVVLILGFYVNM